MKALELGSLFKVLRLDITFGREVYHLGIKMKKIWQSSYSFHYPQWQNARANVMTNLWNLNKLPNTRVFVAAANGSVEVLELVALFLLKTGTLRGGPCKNRPLEFPRETEFRHFFSATKLAHSINKNRICLAHSAFLKKLGGDLPGRSKAVMIVFFRLFKARKNFALIQIA